MNRSGSQLLLRAAVLAGAGAAIWAAGELAASGSAWADERPGGLAGVTNVVSGIVETPLPELTTPVPDSAPDDDTPIIPAIAGITTQILDTTGSALPATLDPVARLADPAAKAAVDEVQRLLAPVQDMQTPEADPVTELPVAAASPSGVAAPATTFPVAATRHLVVVHLAEPLVAAAWLPTRTPVGHGEGQRPLPDDVLRQATLTNPPASAPDAVSLAGWDITLLGAGITASDDAYPRGHAPAPGTRPA